MANENSNPKVWTQEEILAIWPQANGELRGFQHALERRSGLTASQLGMALQLAEAEFNRLSGKDSAKETWVRARRH